MLRSLVISLTAGSLAALALVVPASGFGTSCQSVAHPFPGTRYADVAISRIEVRGASCTTARRIAVGAQRKALGMTPSPNGLKVFTYMGYSVTGDLHGVHDTYYAEKGPAQIVRWRF